jgi:hypothetical protein
LSAKIHFNEYNKRALASNARNKFPVPFRARLAQKRII